MIKRLLAVVTVVGLLVVLVPVKSVASEPVKHQVITKQQQMPVQLLKFLSTKMQAVLYPFLPDFTFWKAQKKNKTCGNETGESSEMRRIPNYHKPIPLPPEK